MFAANILQLIVGHERLNVIVLINCVNNIVLLINHVEIFLIQFLPTTRLEPGALQKLVRRSTRPMNCDSSVDQRSDPTGRASTLKYAIDPKVELCEVRVGPEVFRTDPDTATLDSRPRDRKPKTLFVETSRVLTARYLNR